MKKIIIALMLLAGLFLYAEEPLEVMKDVDRELQSIALQAHDATTLEAVLVLMKKLTHQMSRYAYATMDMQKQLIETQTYPDSLDRTLIQYGSNMQKSMIEMEMAVRKFETEPRMKEALKEYRSKMNELDRLMHESLDDRKNEKPEQE